MLSCSAVGLEHGLGGECRATYTALVLGGFMLLNGKSYGVPDDSDASIDEKEEDISEEDEYTDAEDDGVIEIWER